MLFLTLCLTFYFIQWQTVRNQVFALTSHARHLVRLDQGSAITTMNAQETWSVVITDVGRFACLLVTLRLLLVRVARLLDIIFRWPEGQHLRCKVVHWTQRMQTCLHQKLFYATLRPSLEYVRCGIMLRANKRAFNYLQHSVSMRLA